MIVTIDGPCGTGKSSVAQKIAKANGFLYFDSGALYRLVAYQIEKKPTLEIDHVFEGFDFDIKENQGEYTYFLNGEDVTLAIRQPLISKKASLVSQNPMIRDKLLPFQRAFGARHSIVMEGRDIGTVVFPDAEIKIFLTASQEERALRRLHQLRSKFPHQTHHFEQVMADLRERDYQDESRSLAPLKPAPDGVVIDTTKMKEDQVVAYINRLIEVKK